MFDCRYRCGMLEYWGFSAYMCVNPTNIYLVLLFWASPCQRCLCLEIWARINAWSVLLLLPCNVPRFLRTSQSPVEFNRSRIGINSKPIITESNGMNNCSYCTQAEAHSNCTVQLRHQTTEARNPMSCVSVHVCRVQTTGLIAYKLSHDYDDWTFCCDM